MTALTRPAPLSIEEYLEDYLRLEAVVPLPEIDADLALAEVYEGIGI